MSAWPLILLLPFLAGLIWLAATAPPSPTHCDKCGSQLRLVPERYGLQLNTAMVLECPKCD